MYLVYDPRKVKYIGRFDSVFFAECACAAELDCCSNDNPFIICNNGKVLAPVVNTEEDAVEFCETTLDEVFHEDAAEELSGKVAFWKSKFLH